MMNRGLYFLLLCFVTLLVSCTYDKEDVLYGTIQCDTSAVSYTAEIVPIFNNNCNSCHNVTDRQGDINLSTYSDVLQVVNNGKVIGSINHEYGFSAMPQGAAKLSQCNIDMISAWIHQGALNN